METSVGAIVLGSAGKQSGTSLPQRRKSGDMRPRKKEKYENFTNVPTVAGGVFSTYFVCTVS